jgi:hypothetical protein
MSGPHNPQDPPNLLASFAMKSGPRSPQDPHLLAMSAGGNGNAGEPVSPAAQTAEANAEKVSIRITIRKPEPLAVALSSPDPMKIELRKIEIKIFNKRDLVFSTLISDASDQTVEDASKPRLFPLNSEELQKLMPHMQIGNTAVVIVEYLAQTHGELHITIVGHEREHSLEEILKQVVHAG